jgi:hypothetical protein
MSGTLGASLTDVTVVIVHQQFFFMGTCVLLKFYRKFFTYEMFSKVPKIDYLKDFQLDCRSPIEKRLSV